MRSTNFEQVRDFQKEVLGNVMPAQARFPKDPDHSIRCLEEELSEFVESVEENDLVGAVDALTDLVYFALGTAYQMGVDFDQVFQMVHTANMAKRRGVTKRGETENGDAFKPLDWQDPKIAIRAYLYGTPKP